MYRPTSPPVRGILDLDDLGAEVGEVDAAERTSAELLDREDPHILERLHGSTVVASPRARTRAAVRAISLPTIIMPSSPPIPGLARIWSAPQAIATCAVT